MSSKYNKSEAEIYREFEEEEIAEERQYKESLIARDENFQRELLNKKLESMDKLSNSISNLASSIIQQRPTPIINIFIDKDTAPENVIKLISEANNSLNSL